MRTRGGQVPTSAFAVTFVFHVNSLWDLRIRPKLKSRFRSKCKFKHIIEVR